MASSLPNITKKGELASISSQLLADPAGKADVGMPNRATIESQPPISASQAIQNAAQNIMTLWRTLMWFRPSNRRATAAISYSKPPAPAGLMSGGFGCP